MNADTKTENEIRALLKDLNNHFTSRDMKGLFCCFALDANIIVYRAQAIEKRIDLDQIRSQIENHWSQTESSALQFVSASISNAGQFVWADVDGVLKYKSNGQDKSDIPRITFLLKKRFSRWFIQQVQYRMFEQNIS